MQLEDSLWNSLTDMHIKTPMGVTAENLAVKYNLTREEVDKFALQSQQRWAQGLLYNTKYMASYAESTENKFNLKLNVTL